MLESEVFYLAGLNLTLPLEPKALGPLFGPLIVLISQLISIEHGFLQVASSKPPSSMHYFDYGYSNIRTLLKLPKLETFISRQDSLVA